MRMHWFKGQQHFQSFFALLSEAQREIPDKELSRWAARELLIGWDRIMQVLKVLKAEDQERTKVELAKATAGERERRKAERDAADAERQRVAAEKAAKREAAEQEAIEKRRAKELAEARHQMQIAATKRREADENDLRDRQEQRLKTRKEHRETPQARPSTRRRVIMQNPDDLEQIKQFQIMIAEGEARWIEGTIGLAQALHAKRQAFGKDNAAFGDWYKKTTLPYGPDDRAALINLGGLEVVRLREILQSTQSRSYELIWQQAKPKLTIVS